MNACATNNLNKQYIENAMSILIVDDDNDLAMSLKDMLEIEYPDAHIDVANNVDATHKYIRAYSPDIVLIDIKLGAENGLDLVPFVKKAHPHSACIMMTAFRETDYAIKALRVGADEYILKPIEPVSLFRMIKQIRKQMAVEKQRDELEKRFRTMFEESFEFYFLLDPTGHIIDANNTALTTTGIDKSRVVGTHLGNAPWWNVKNETLMSIHNCISGALKGEHRRDEFGVVNVDRDVRIFDFSFKPVPDANGNISVLLAEGRDISERKQYEDKLSQLNSELEERVTMRTIALEKASRAKSEFLSRMSHELRTPLNIILGYTQILEIKGKDRFTEDDMESIHEIHNAGDHLLELVTDVLDLTRIEKNKLSPSIAPVDLQSSLEEIINMMGVKASQHNKTISLLPGTSVSVTADKTRFRQILVNLINNALHYGGNIEISYSPNNDNMVRINVHDDGPGIEAHKQAMLFVPFERLGKEDTVDGAGIGLSISQNLVELMGGKIGVDSKPGQGSTFWFELPIAD
jgi:PAS domain S-box-containing protein